MQVCLLLLVASAASAQVLARPGLAGSGLKNSPWWQHAVFYQVDRSPDSLDFKAIPARLDALRSLGVDALLLPAPELPAPGTNAAMPSFDDLDNLLRQASAHRIRVLLTIHASSPTADLSGVARFWLTRGVAGLHIAAAPGTSPDDAQAAVQKLRKLASTFAGQRIILNDLDVAETANDAQTKRLTTNRTSRTANASTMQLQIDNRADRLSTLDAASLRPLLAQSIADPNLLLDLHAPASPNQRSPLAEATAAIALLTRPAALIDANLVLQPTPEPQPEAPEESAKPAAPRPPAAPPGTFLPYVPYVPPPKPKVATAPKPELVDPLTSWYQQLAALRGSNIALRSGSKTLLDFDAQNTLVWVSRPASPSGRTPPAFVAINLSSSPVQLSLAEAIKKLNLHGFFLRTLLRSDQAMGAQDINAVSLPPFGVYIGELRL
jgi:alpha-glucosidase